MSYVNNFLFFGGWGERNSIVFRSTDEVVVWCRSVLAQPNTWSHKCVCWGRDSCAYKKAPLITATERHIHTYTRTHICVCVCKWEMLRRKKSLRAFGSSTGVDKVVWGLLTWPMIHNWGRTAVAGSTDMSQGGWQMIGPSGAELSISPNVPCTLSAHLSSWASLVYVNVVVTDTPSVWARWMWGKLFVTHAGYHPRGELRKNVNVHNKDFLFFVLYCTLFICIFFSA